MSRSYTPPHYTAVGFQMMGHIFEQQVRIAQVMGAAAIASNPLLAQPVRSAAAPRAKAPTLPTPYAVRSDLRPNEVTMRRKRAPSAPPRMPELFARTHATPV